MLGVKEYEKNYKEERNIVFLNRHKCYPPNSLNFLKTNKNKK